MLRNIFKYRELSKCNASHLNSYMLSYTAFKEVIFTLFPTEKISGIPVEFHQKSSGIKGTFFHWKRVIPLEFPLNSSGNSTGFSGI